VAYDGHSLSPRDEPTWLEPVQWREAPASASHATGLRRRLPAQGAAGVGGGTGPSAADIVRRQGPSTRGPITPDKSPLAGRPHGRPTPAGTPYIEPGSPWENGYLESSNGKLRDELRDRGVLDTLLEAKVLVARWRRHYNEERPHSSLGNLAPEHFARAATATATDALPS